MHLVVPSSLYKKSFLEALQEYQQEKTKYHQDLTALDSTDLKNNFQAYVDKLIDEAAGKNLPGGYVAHTDYWLVDKNEVIGRVDIRHVLSQKLLREGGHIGYDIRPSKRRMGYGKKILELVLPKTKELGLTKVLVTCDENNIGSRRIIEANGGTFENSVEMGEGNPRKLRYWIIL